MKQNYLSRFLTILALVAGFTASTYTSQAQVIITQWDFNAENTNPTIGSGTADLVGGTTATYAAGFTGNPDRGWNTSTYPEQGTNQSTAGVQFSAATTTFSNISQIGRAHV